MKIIEALEREGGHVLLLLLLTLFFGMLIACCAPNQIINDAFAGFAGALLFCMKGSGTQKTAADVPDADRTNERPPAKPAEPSGISG